METLVILFLNIVVCLLVSLLGKNRIGWGWSFVLCFFLTPIIGLIIILCCKKKDVEFVDVK